MAGDLQAFDSLMDQGHSAAWDQSWDLAAKFYRQALEEFPEQPQALVSLGLALFELNSNERALQCYLKAARLSPQDPMPVEKISQLYERLGNATRAYQAGCFAAELYLKNRDVGKAQQVWERAVHLMPGEPQAYTRLAALYEVSGDKEHAVQEYLALASVQQAAGHPIDAFASIERALKVIPASPQALQYQELLKASQPLPRIETVHQPTLKIDSSAKIVPGAPPLPDWTEHADDPVEEACETALRSLASLLFEPLSLEQPSTPTHPVASGIPLGSPGKQPFQEQNRMLLHLARVIELQTRLEFDETSTELQKAVEAGLDHPAAYFDLGYLFTRAGRHVEAVSLLKRLINQPDYALAAHLLMGGLFLQMDSSFEASLEYLEALKWADMLTSPSSTHENLLRLYGSLVEAYRLDPSSKMQPGFCEHVVNLLMRPDWRLQVERARGRGTVEARPLAEALEVAGDNPLVSALGKVHQLKSARRLRSAMEEAFYALEIAPLYLPLHTLMADLLVELGEIPQAFEKYRIIARVYSMRGEGYQAISLYRKVIDLAPTEIQVREQLIAELLASGQVENAALEKMKLAEIYISLADLARARETYALALNLDFPAKISLAARIRILERMADIDLQSLDWRQAVRIYEQIKALQPENDHARCQLINLYYQIGQENTALRELTGYLDYLESTGRQARKLTLLEELVRDHPSNLHLRQLLAETYRDQGRSHDAVVQYDWIGEKLLTSGDRPGAIASVRQILSLNPPNKPEYEHLLSQLSLGKI